MSERATRPTPPDQADNLPAATPQPAKRIGNGIGGAGLTQRMAAPRSLAEAEAHYVSCRDAWTAAMRAAASGRPADMATLAICQEAYEAAAIERDRWLSGQRIAIPVEPEPERPPIDVVVEQTMAWREVQEHEQPRGFLGRLFGRRDRDRS
ncbi:MAG TPA: hypothetical protein VFP30_02865 [Candidatus Limnocylindria bacterium]|nr:hypothetical protein [Candidatus Limnocylindria bacterium]